jgi:hypothetical protein
MDTYRQNYNLVILCFLRVEGKQNSDTNNEMAKVPTAPNTD